MIWNSDLQSVKPSTRSKEVMVDNTSTNSNAGTTVIWNKQTFINLCNKSVWTWKDPTYDQIKLAIKRGGLIYVTPAHTSLFTPVVDCLDGTCIPLRSPQTILMACLWEQDTGSPCRPMATLSMCFSPSILMGLKLEIFFTLQQNVNFKEIWMGLKWNIFYLATKCEWVRN